jgi:hypothetical protein
MLYRKVVFLLTLVLTSSVLPHAQGKKTKDNKGQELGIVITAKSDMSKSKKSTVIEKTANSKKTSGLFVLYQDTLTGSVQLYITKKQLGKEFIYQSFSMGGPTELFLNQNMFRETWLFSLRKNFDKIVFVRQNANYYYDPANAVSKSANVDVSEAVFYSEKVVAEDVDGFLISADGLFLSEKLDAIKPFLPQGLPPGAVFNLGTLNVAKSNYLKLSSFPNNTDVIVSLAYENPSPIKLGGKEITDARYVQIKMQHSFIQVPDNDYQVRYDDPRVGYFTQEIDDMTTTRIPNYKDLISRWHLVKKDPQETLSEPVEPIVWWIENTTPVEIRKTITQAGLKWNEAFERAGFKNAIVMRQMPDTASWDPSDMRYNAIRWVSSNLGYAIGQRIVNPRTGQILGADITIDYRTLALFTSDEQTYSSLTGLIKSEESINAALAKHNCSLARGMHMMQTSAFTIAEAIGAEPEELATLSDQYLTYIVMHEMGHTMGLSHNMKGSIMLSPKEIHNKDITRKWGLTGSVMDYPAVNIALDKSKQGDYYTTKTGPYDWWAIEYGYSQFTSEKEKAGLDKILAKSTDSKLAFGNDADMIFPGRGLDPHVSDVDMTNDIVTYAEDRFKTVNLTMAYIKDRFVKPSQSYADLRTRYFALTWQRYSMAYNLSRQIGGIYVDRSFPEQHSPAKPFTPVPAVYQESAMKMLAKYIFSPSAFDSDKELYPYLQMQRRALNSFGSTEDPKILLIVAGIQNIPFNLILDPVTLSRSTSTTLYGNTYTVAEIISDLIKACFNEDIATSVNAYRQMLQNELVQRLIEIVNDPAKKYDNAAKAASYYHLKKLKSVLGQSLGGNTQTKAHRSSLIYFIDKNLSITK